MLKTNNKNNKYNRGKVEFLSCIEFIQEQFALGNTRTFIFAALVEKKQYSMSYDTFCYHMRHFFPSPDQEKHTFPMKKVNEGKSTEKKTNFPGSKSPSGFIRPKDMADKPLI